MTINTGTHTEITKIQIDGSQGKLSAIVQKPQTKPGEKIPMVLLFHGFSSNKQDIIISTLADKLSAKGIASIRIDFNGHGESEGAFYKMTVLNEIEDAKKTLNYAKTLNYVSSVSVAGHSQGGVVASMLAGTAGEEQIQSAVLLAPAAVLRDDAIRGQTFGVMYDPFNPPEKIQLGENCAKVYRPRLPDSRNRRQSGALHLQRTLPRTLQKQHSSSPAKSRPRLFAGLAGSNEHCR